MTYTPYKGLVSLQNSPTLHDTGFNWQGHSRMMAERYSIINKDMVEVSFVQQPPQDDLLYHMSLYYFIWVLKARKLGFSSTALGVGTNKFLVGKNEKCVSMSFEQTASQKQLARAKHYIKSYEINRSRALGKEFKVPFKYNSKTELVWEGKETNDLGAYDHWQNTLRVGTAGADSFGRGDDITYLHITEVAFCKDVKALMAGVGEACVRGAHKIFETTANGFNSYKQGWDSVVSNEIDAAALFYSPLWEYSEAYIQDKYRTLGRLGPQEYPMTPEEAFLTSGELYFDNLSLRELLKMTREPMKV